MVPGLIAINPTEICGIDADAGAVDAGTLMQFRAPKSSGRKDPFPIALNCK
jgi:hypothetical protein